MDAVAKKRVAVPVTVAFAPNVTAVPEMVEEVPNGMPPLLAAAPMVPVIPVVVPVIVTTALPEVMLPVVVTPPRKTCPLATLEPG